MRNAGEPLYSVKCSHANNGDHVNNDDHNNGYKFEWY